MRDLSRRDWLSGVVTSVVGAQLVIATKGRIEGLVIPDREVKVFTPADMKLETTTLGPGCMLFTLHGDGSYHPIGFLTEITASVDEPLRGEFAMTHGVDYPRTMKVEGRFIMTGGTQVPVFPGLPGRRRRV